MTYRICKGARVPSPRCLHFNGERVRVRRGGGNRSLLVDVSSPIDRVANGRHKGWRVGPAATYRIYLEGALRRATLSQLEKFDGRAMPCRIKDWIGPLSGPSRWMLRLDRTVELRQCGSDFKINLLCDLGGYMTVDTEVPNGAFDLGMPEKV